ncbi:MAG: hypothetical protein R3C01_15335 [Planctomycetaceae bacterium]
MPYLMVNLDDPADCLRGLMTLQNCSGVNGGALSGSCGEPVRRGRGRRRGDHFGSGMGPRAEREMGPGHRRRRPNEIDSQGLATDAEQVTELPLRKKLERIRHRGIWQHLVRVAQEINDPKSLPELDALLDLPKNKMRSLKAIMGKLEHRFGIRFLRPEPDAGVDDAGNPRYIMPPHIRKQILKMTETVD